MTKGKQRITVDTFRMDTSTNDSEEEETKVCSNRETPISITVTEETYGE